MDEHEQQQAPDRDGDAHRATPRRQGLADDLAGGGIGLHDLREVLEGSRLDRVERALHELGDLEERAAAGEEGRDGLLVGGVQGARREAARLAGGARERQAAERLGVRRLEREREAAPRGRAAPMRAAARAPDT